MSLHYPKTTKRHECAYPGCKKQIELKLYACKPHWFSLPEAGRNAIWEAYRGGDKMALGRASIGAKRYWNDARKAEQTERAT